MTAHIPALSNEIAGLIGDVCGTYVDCTLGDGGHSELILEKAAPGSILVAIDRDDEAITVSQSRLQRFGDVVRYVNANYGDIRSVFEAEELRGADFFLFDLGVSTRQILQGERGFSIKNDGPLDMRMDRSQKRSAFDIVNNASESELRKIIREFGEERFSGRVTRKILEIRKQGPISTTGELASVVRSVVPRRRGAVSIDPATLTFQGLRIAVNGELDSIDTGVRGAVELLRKGGKVCVISYHSLEDRLIKNIFKEFAKGCICPPVLPICGCGREPSLKIVTKKPIRPSPGEIKSNKRVRSALLRVAEKI